MSFTREANSSMPKIIGGGLVLAGALSGWSMAVGGAPVLNLPGTSFWDAVGAIGGVVTGVAIWRDNSPTAAWLGAGLLALGVTSAGWEFSTKQAGAMAGAAGRMANAVAEEARKTNGTASTVGGWIAEGNLSQAAVAECKAGVKAWTKTDLGRVRCTPASDGGYYKWVRQ